MTSFIGSSSGYFGRSIHGQTQKASNQNLELSRDVYRYQILYYNVIETLNDYITYYITGDYSNLKTGFTTTKQNSLISILQEDDYFYNTNIDNLSDFSYDSGMFENFRNNTYYILDGLIQAISQYDQVDALQNEVSQYSAILATEETILEYLNSSKQPSQVAFTASQVYNTTIVLKPWYERYIINYGAPNDGIFLTERLATVVAALVDEGVITIDQFTSNTYS
jgi:hypothetical protein